MRGLDDYIEEYRYDVEDEHGRDPLFTTQQGRISKTTIRNWVYRLTQPCFYEGECPHDTSPEECRAADSTDYPYECPDSVATHAIRRGSITYLLRNDAPKSVTSSRADVSERVLHLHYDSRSDKEQMANRRDHLPGSDGAVTRNRWFPLETAGFCRRDEYTPLIFPQYSAG